MTILMADDDDEDCSFAKEAIDASGAPAIFDAVKDGVELLDYLSKRFLSDPSRLPGVILLDLNMPRKDGRESLLEIKSDPRLLSIPVIILTTSTEKKDMAFTAEAGADSFVSKPDTFSGWVKVMKLITKNWLKRSEAMKF
jgi:CheY-like chemotaxis protein